MKRELLHVIVDILAEINVAQHWQEACESANLMSAGKRIRKKASRSNKENQPDCEHYETDQIDEND